ncbi:MAG: hypothetical protein H7Y12_00505 [Sphingobacteriaceae bacterium]|nr:hypothetical protein [Cytophagaceae bacterium]
MKTLTVHYEETQEKVLLTLLEYLNISFEKDTPETQDWERLTASQFMQGYDEEDAIYDQVK